MNLKSLIQRLSPQARDALEGAAAITLSRTHYDIEPEHWLLKLSEQPDGEVSTIFHHFDVDVGRVATKLNALIDQFKSGNGRPPALSPRLIRIAREAWLDASIERQAERVGGGDILLTMLLDRDTGPALREAVSELKRVPPESLAANLLAITGAAREGSSASPTAEGETVGAPRRHRARRSIPIASI